MDLFDRIIVLDRGSLVEQGTHRQLLDRRGLYAGLYRQQSDVFASPQS
jgi:ABC-type multidrug transport system fused ATPase/permease subunit